MSIRPSEPTASRLEPPVAVTGRRRQRHGWWAWLRLIFLALTLAVATSLVIALPLLPTERVVIEVGDVAQQDVRAPRRVTFESAILRAEEQERAAQRVEPVYTAPDPTPARQQLDRARRVLDYIGSVLGDPLASLAQKRNWLMAVPELSDGSAPLDPETLNQLLTLPEASWNRVQLETLAVLDQAMRREIREGQLEPIAEMVPALVSLDLNDQETAVTIGLVLPFLVPNSYLDAEATAAAQAAAREQVPPVLRSFEANEIIVREGTRVTALDIEALDQLGLRKSHVVWTDVASSGLLSLTASVLLFVYVGHFQHEILWNGRQLLLLVTLTVFFTVIAGLMVPAGVVLRYLVPLPALAMLTTATLGAHAGCAVAVFGGLAAGAIAENSMEMLTYAALGSLIAALSLGRIERVRPLFRAGLFASLLHVATLGIFRLPQQPAEARALIVPMLAAIANGGISASLALGGLFLIGPLFDVITTIRLMELSRPDQPLLRRLLREAPGTYHHSLLVANLAEQAAERIGADALLTRVGAYYHDVGKIAQPAFFIENQVEGVNLHAQLEPQASAEVIIGHVRNGLEIARRYRLPRRIRAFIPEHHGTGWLRYFYSKALEASGPNGTVKESAFRYPGLRPQSKETALVMLADSCEAAVRSSRPTSDEQIAEIVNRVIDQHVADGQLDECDLTLRDLEAIRQTMIDTLRGVFHPRIEYPRLPRTEPREHTIRAPEQ